MAVPCMLYVFNEYLNDWKKMNQRIGYKAGKKKPRTKRNQMQEVRLHLLSTYHVQSVVISLVQKLFSMICLPLE